MTLAEYLEKWNISRADCAAALEISKPTICRIINNGETSLDVARRIYAWSRRRVNLLKDY